MAGRIQSTAAKRRAARADDERRQRLIVAAALGGLLVVALIIVAGLYVTQYRAPRAHVLAIGERDFDAVALARRATYYALFEGGLNDVGATSMAQRATDLIVDEEVLRTRAPAVVGPITEQEIDAEVSARLGLEESADRQEFAEALQDVLRAAGLSRDEYFDLFAAEMLTERLRVDFEEGVEAAVTQVRLSRIRLTDQESAEEVRELALAGEDFTQLVLDRTADSDHRDDGGDLGWAPLALLDDEVVAAVAELEAGGVADVVATGLFFDVYLVREREEERELDQGQVVLLVRSRLNDWLDAERLNVEVNVDLSGDEEDWINERVVSRVSEALAR